MSVANLAAGYPDLPEQRGLWDVAVLGSSFGGWVAAETAIQDGANRLNRLHVDAVGPRPRTAAPTGSRPPSPCSQAHTGPDMYDAELLQHLVRISTPALVV